MMLKRAAMPAITALGLVLIMVSSAVASPPSRTTVRAHGQRVQYVSGFGDPYYNFDLNARTTGSGASGSYSIVSLTGEVFIDGTVTCLHATTDYLGNPGVSVSGFIRRSDIGIAGTYYLVSLLHTTVVDYISLNESRAVPIDCATYVVDPNTFLQIHNGTLHITTR